MPPSSKTKAEATIQIQGARFEECMVTIEGTSPLISDRMHWSKLAPEGLPPEMRPKAVEVAPGKRAPRDLQRQFHESIYWVDEAAGVFGYPGGAIKEAIVTAGQRFCGQKKTELNGILIVQGDLIPLDCDAPEMFVHHTRNSGIGRTPDVRARARYHRWGMTVPIRFAADFISEKSILNLFQTAGEMVGIGNWRPELGGWSGQFRPTTLVKKE